MSIGEAGGSMFGIHRSEGRGAGFGEGKSNVALAKGREGWFETWIAQLS